MSKRAILFLNIYKKNAAEAAVVIKSELEKLNTETTVFSFEGKLHPPLDLNFYKWQNERSSSDNNSRRRWDIAFSLGGDGTVLYAARNLAPLDVPILPINMGTLGFIAEVSMKDWLDIFLKWEKGELEISRRCMLDIFVERNSEIIMKGICLNDAVISHTGIAKLIKLDVCLNSGENESSKTDLGTYRCDGLIIATPTGSTAYSMAAGGPILDPEMEAVILNPICPFSLSNRPLVLTSRQTVAVSVPVHQRSDVLLTIDGQDTFNLKSLVKVMVRQASHPALLLMAGKNEYYSALRNKLFWSPSLTGEEAHA